MPNFIKVETHCNFETKSAPVQDPRFSNIIFELDLLRVPIFIALRIYFIFGPNFPGMRGLILVLMSNVCCLAVILIFWWLLGGYCSLPSGNYWLVFVTGGYCLLPLVTARSHFWYELKLQYFMQWRCSSTKFFSQYILGTIMFH